MYFETHLYDSYIARIVTEKSHFYEIRTHILMYFLTNSVAICAKLTVLFNFNQHYIALYKNLYKSDLCFRQTSLETSNVHSHQATMNRYDLLLLLAVALFTGLLEGNTLYNVYHKGPEFELLFMGFVLLIEKIVAWITDIQFVMMLFTIYYRFKDINQYLKSLKMVNQTKYVSQLQLGKILNEMRLDPNSTSRRVTSNDKYNGRGSNLESMQRGRHTTAWRHNHLYGLHGITDSYSRLLERNNIFSFPNNLVDDILNQPTPPRTNIQTTNGTLDQPINKTNNQTTNRILDQPINKPCNQTIQRSEHQRINVTMAQVVDSLVQNKATTGYHKEHNNKATSGYYKEHNQTNYDSNSRDYNEGNNLTSNNSNSTNNQISNNSNNTQTNNSNNNKSNQVNNSNNKNTQTNNESSSAKENTQTNNSNNNESNQSNNSSSRNNQTNSSSANRKTNSQLHTGWNMSVDRIERSGRSLLGKVLNIKDKEKIIIDTDTVSRDKRNEEGTGDSMEYEALDAVRKYSFKHEPIQYGRHSDYIRRRNYRLHASALQYNSDPTLLYTNIHNVRMSHKFLCESCICVNEMFKYYNLVSVLLIIYGIAFSVYYCLFHMSFYHYTIAVYVIKLMLKFNFKLFLIVTFPHITTTEVSKTREYLASISSADYTLNIKKEISLFWDDVTSKTIEFSACGFITLNSKFVATAIAAGAANLIIFIQFQKDVWTRLGITTRIHEIQDKQ
ncbi:hypothetical protein M8J75_002338 [Diaphorina citri]|nr:hypothetical protein M8J75_002338 [Diaphorina citri]